MRHDLLGTVLAAVVAVAAVAAGSMASSLAAQSLAREIELAPAGWVVFQYALERDVEICADGGMRRGDSWRMRWSDDRGDFCARGRAQAELRVQDGEVIDVEIQPPSMGRRTSSDTDLGERDPQEVADYFMTLASESPRRDVAEDAIMPAVLAEGVTVWPQLKDIALDRGLDDDVREGAIFWLGQRDGGGEYLQELYRSVDSRELKEKIIFSVSQSGEDQDVRWLLDRAQDPSESTEVRKNALFWLGQSDDPRVAEFLLELIRAR